jgi:SAM-dependent methyltransferase
MRMRTSSLPWSWGSKISEQLLHDGLASVNALLVGTVLDVGCGMKPYKKLLGTHADRWIGLDFETTASGRSAADIFGTALQLPFRDAEFDAVLATQVLEHVPQPGALVREAGRVLKPGGHLVLTAPQTNPLHEEPHDYYRYTCHGLRSLTEEAGLQVLEIRPLGGAIATVAQMIVWHLNWIRRTPAVGTPLGNGVSASLAWLALRLDRFSQKYGGGATKDTLNWLLVAKRPCN